MLCHANMVQACGGEKEHILCTEKLSSFVICVVSFKKIVQNCSFESKETHSSMPTTHFLSSLLQKKKDREQFVSPIVWVCTFCFFSIRSFRTLVHVRAILLCAFCKLSNCFRSISLALQRFERLSYSERLWVPSLQGSQRRKERGSISISISFLSIDLSRLTLSLLLYVEFLCDTFWRERTVLRRKEEAQYLCQSQATERERKKNPVTRKEIRWTLGMDIPLEKETRKSTNSSWSFLSVDDSDGHPLSPYQSFYYRVHRHPSESVASSSPRTFDFYANLSSWLQYLPISYWVVNGVLLLENVLAISCVFHMSQGRIWLIFLCIFCIHKFFLCLSNAN